MADGSDQEADGRREVSWFLNILQTGFQAELYQIGRKYKKSHGRGLGFLFEDYVTNEHTTKDVRDHLVNSFERFELGTHGKAELESSWIIFEYYVSKYFSCDLEFDKISEPQGENDSDAVTIWVYFPKMVKKITIELWKRDPQSSTNQSLLENQRKTPEKRKRGVSPVQKDEARRFGCLAYASTHEFHFFKCGRGLQMEVNALRIAAKEHFSGGVIEMNLFGPYSGKFKKNQLGNLRDIPLGYDDSQDAMHDKLFNSVKEGETYVVPENGRSLIREAQERSENNASKWSLDGWRDDSKTVTLGEMLSKSSVRDRRLSDLEKITAAAWLEFKKKCVN